MTQPTGMPDVPLRPDAGLTDVARQVATNLRTLQDLSANYVAALQASVSDRANIHTQLDAQGAAQAAATTAATTATATASAASGAANTAKAAADAAKAAADKAASDLTALAARRSRSAPAVTVPAMLSLLGGAASVDVVVTWTTPWPDTEYAVVPVMDVPSALLGKVSAVVKSKATASCTLTVTTTAVLSASTSTVRAVSVST